MQSITPGGAKVLRDVCVCGANTLRVPQDGDSRKHHFHPFRRSAFICRKCSSGRVVGLLSFLLFMHYMLTSHRYWKLHLTEQHCSKEALAGTGVGRDGALWPKAYFVSKTVSIPRHSSHVQLKHLYFIGKTDSQVKQSLVIH